MAELQSVNQIFEHVAKPTKNTQVWWQALTGWSQVEADAKRRAVVSRLRERWPANSKLNDKKLAVRQWLAPLVASFNENHWPADVPPNERRDRQVGYYTSWALYLNRTYDVPAPIPFTSPAVKTPSYSFVQSAPVTPLVVKQADIVAKRSSGGWSETTSSSDAPLTDFKSERTATEPASTSKHELSYFDWDDIEVKIDAVTLCLGTVWLPMLDLKPEPKRQPCHWADFRIAALYDQFSADTKYTVSTATHEFVYTANEEDFSFFRDGAYKVVLRRFLQQAAFSNVLRLRIQRRSIQDNSKSQTATVAHIGIDEFR